MSETYFSKQLAAGEEIRLITKQHWLILVRETYKAALVLVVLLALVIVLRAEVFKHHSWVLWGLFLLVVPGAFFVVGVLSYLTRKFIVTTRRVAQVSGIVSKTVIDSSLEKVNDVLLKQSLIGRLLNYGDIEILTASDVGINKFAKLRRPVDFKTSMLDAKEQMEQQFIDLLHFTDYAMAYFRSIPALPEKDLYAYVPINMGWHAYEILRDPQKPTFYYYLDGQLVDTYNPVHAREWDQAPLQLVIYSWKGFFEHGGELAGTRFELDQFIIGGFKNE